MRPAMMTMRAESAQGKLFLENMFIVVWLFSCLVVWFFAVRSGRAERFGGLVVWVSRVDTRDTGAGGVFSCFVGSLQAKRQSRAGGLVIWLLCYI